MAYITSVVFSYSLAFIFSPLCFCSNHLVIRTPQLCLCLICFFFFFSFEKSFVNVTSLSLYIIWLFSVPSSNFFVLHIIIIIIIITIIIIILILYYGINCFSCPIYFMFYMILVHLWSILLSVSEVFIYDLVEDVFWPFEWVIFIFFYSYYS